MSDEDTRPATKQEIAAAGYWFGPRRGVSGWGWTPVSWQGWAVMGGCVAAFIAAEIAGRDEGYDLLYALSAIAVLLAVCWWKGTAPGPSKKATGQLREIAGRRSDGDGIVG